MISGYVDISQVVYEACERLGISNSEAYEMRFLRLILDAEIKISTGLISVKKIKIVEPGNSSFSDGRKLIIPHELISDLCVLDLEGNKIDKCSYSFFGKRIIFKEVQTKAVVLVYIGIEFDINDQPVISHNHFEAVVSYLVFMETTTRYHSKKAAYYEFRDAREWWQDRLGEARGNDAFPNKNDISEASEIYHSTMCLKNGNVNCSPCDLKAFLSQYNNILNEITYGILLLENSIDVAEDYTTEILSQKTISTVTEMISDDFVLDVLNPGRFVVVLPYELGLINGLYDENNIDVFEEFFNIIKDDLRQITIYVAHEFINVKKYKLKFNFSN